MRLSAAAVALLTLACTMTSTSSTIAPTNSLAIVNARVWTGDPKRPWADAVAIAGDRIVAAGSSAEIQKQTSAATRIIDARGQRLAPGFIDSHVHFMSGGVVPSSAAPDRPECKARGLPPDKVARRTPPAGAAEAVAEQE